MSYFGFGVDQSLIVNLHAEVAADNMFVILSDLNPIHVPDKTSLSPVWCRPSKASMNCGFTFVANRPKASSLMSVFSSDAATFRVTTTSLISMALIFKWSAYSADFATLNWPRSILEIGPL
jgi:hypothetical protein